ncbi:MAG: hypothetical protein RL693_1798 [Verrucomicrobiota bacterium]|jgi:uncharacterized protein YqeY
MSQISAQITEDMKTDMRAKDTVALNLVRGLRFAAKGSSTSGPDYTLGAYW